MESDERLVNSAKIYPHEASLYSRRFALHAAPTVGRESSWNQFQRSFQRWAQRNERCGAGALGSSPGSSEVKSSEGRLGSGSSCPLLIRIKPKLIPAPLLQPRAGDFQAFCRVFKGRHLRAPALPRLPPRLRVGAGSAGAGSWRCPPGMDVKKPSWGGWHRAVALSTAS